MSSFSLNHLSPSDHTCYVHCNFCSTILAVSVPCSSFSETITVRCGHCTNHLSVNMQGMLPPAANQLLEEIPGPAPNLLPDHQSNPKVHPKMIPNRGEYNEPQRPPAANRRARL